MAQKIFDTLFKLTSTGKLQEWTIEVNGNAITTRFGQTGGTIQLSEPTICDGKNIGRSNETTPEEQALLEAQSQWEKKQKAGNYTPDRVAALAGQSSELVEGGILPMLAHSYKDHGHKLRYPVGVQPKLDGFRCTAIVDAAGNVTLWSRTRKQVLTMPHVEAAIRQLGLTDINLDGELYNHTYHNNFDGLSKLIKNGDPRVEYHLYDMPVPGTFAERNKQLGLHVPEQHPLVLVETIEADDEDELMIAFEHFLKLGYEGAIARNLDGLYVNKRSYDLQKIKEFDDAEFTCVAIEEGRGKLAGHAIFVCLAENGVRFNAKMKGDLDKLREYYEHPEMALGKQITVKYQGLTNKNNVPRFPVAKCVREE